MTGNIGCMSGVKSLKAIDIEGKKVLIRELLEGEILPGFGQLNRMDIS